MLTAIRKHTKSLVVKLLAGVLVLSFAVWGVSDVFGPRSMGSTVYTVGDVEVEPFDLEMAVQREISRLRPLLGDEFGVDQAKQLGVVEAVMQRRINEAALTLAARDLGILVSDPLVSREIRNVPAFQGLGGFDRDRFQRALYNSYFTEEGYIQHVRLQLGRDQVIESIGARTAPRILVESLYRRREEKRVVDTVHVSDSAQIAIPEPDAVTIVQYHRDKAVFFTAPEYRALTAVHLTADDLAAEIEVGEQALKDAYDASLGEFTKPERRRVLQMILPDETSAQDARKALAGGRDFTTVAREIAAMDPAGVDLGTVTRDQLLPEVADTVFGLMQGVNGPPVKSPLGWHLFRVAAIEPGETKTFEQTRDVLRKRVAREKAVDSLFELANRLEDLLGGGATLEEAAAKLNVKLLKVPAVDQSGLGANGQPVAGLPGGAFLATAFATDEGTDSQLTETGDDGYFMLRVDGVTPPVLRPFDTVKAAVVAAWKADRRAEESKRVAEAMLDKVKGGARLADVAGAMGLAVKTSPPLARRGEGGESGLPQPLIDAAFATGRGLAAMARSDTGFDVAQVKEIIAADPSSDKDGVDALSERLGEAVEQDILIQLAGALRDRYGVSVDRRTVDELFAGRAGSGAPGRRR